MWTSKTDRELLDHEMSFLVFRQNYKSLVEKASMNPQLIDIKWDIYNTPPEEDFVAATTAFCNFAASAAMLIDHYRVIMKSETTSDDFKPVYDERMIATFSEDLLSLCIKKLRNRLTHKNLAKLYVKSAEKQDGTYIASPYRLYLDIDDVTEGFEWNVKERGYLSSLPRVVDVIDLVTPYYDRVSSFYKWFVCEYVQFHPGSREDLELFHKKVKCRNEEQN